MQLHAKRLQVHHRGRLLRMAAQQADGFEAQAFTGSRQRMQMIGMRATEADDALRADAVGSLEVFDELEPFVAADQRVDLIQTQDRDLDCGAGEPVELQQFEGGLG